MIDEPIYRLSPSSDAPLFRLAIIIDAATEEDLADLWALPAEVLVKPDSGGGDIDLHYALAAAGYSEDGHAAELAAERAKPDSGGGE